MPKKVVTENDQLSIGILSILISLFFGLVTFLLLTGCAPLGVALGLGLLSIIPWFIIVLTIFVLCYLGREWK